MSQISLEDVSHEIIKAHILDPDNSPLPERYRKRLDRGISMFKLLDKHPVARNAIKFHRVLYPEISITTAWKDFHFANRMFSCYQDFDFDFWLTWSISDIVDNISKSKRTNSLKDRMNIAREHTNMVRLLGKRPDEPVDPHRNEKHNYFIIVNLDKKPIKLDMDTLAKLPLNTVQELNKVLFSGHEIDEEGANEIMNS